MRASRGGGGLKICYICLSAFFLCMKLEGKAMGQGTRTCSLTLSLFVHTPQRFEENHGIFNTSYNNPLNNFAQTFNDNKQPG